MPQRLFVSGAPAQTERSGRFPFALARLCLLIPVLALLFAATPAANAQLVRTPLVAVLDFTVPEGGNKILSRQITDSVVLEMQRNATYDVVPRSQVQEAMTAQGLYAPLDRTSLIRLGQALGVRYIATGQLENLSILKGRTGIRVGISMLFLDVQTGEYSNGARASAVAPVPNDPEGSPAEVGQLMLNQAMANAAFQAVGELKEFQLPEATVLMTRSDTVLINGGVRNGIRPGMEFIVLRNGERVGRIRVTAASAYDATAYILDIGKGIRPEDRARAVVSPDEL
ncbi:MAG: hypothetical protein OHK0029_33060 [Armatimonadaceae bacterium]